ncbi:hypothetical protein Tco_1221748 [Tanacetum coccineum]
MISLPLKGGAGLSDFQVGRVIGAGETIKEQNTCSPSPKADKRDWNGLMSKRLGLGYGFTKKACFVYGSFSHLIRDYDFHEKRMAKQVKLNKQKGKATGQGENRPTLKCLVLSPDVKLADENQYKHSDRPDTTQLGTVQPKEHCPTGGLACLECKEPQFMNLTKASDLGQVTF